MRFEFNLFVVLAVGSLVAVVAALGAVFVMSGRESDQEALRDMRDQCKAPEKFEEFPDAEPAAYDVEGVKK